MVRLTRVPRMTVASAARLNLCADRQAENAKTEGNEPDNVLEGGLPVTPGHAEFLPERLEKDLIQNHVLLRNIQIHARPCLVVDDISGALVKQIQGNIVLIFG